MKSKIAYILSHSEVQQDRYFNVMETWGKDVDCLFYSDHSDKNYSNIIKVSDNRQYGSGEEKLVNAINTLPEEYLDYEWFMFADNDTFINTKNLNSLIESDLDINKLHGLTCNCWPKDLSLNYCGGGAGFLMSNQTYKKYFRGQIQTYNSLYGDVAVGLHARSKNIDSQFQNGFNSFPPQQYSMNDPYEISKQYSFHYITNFSMMKQLYENSKSYT